MKQRGRGGGRETLRERERDIGIWTEREMGREETEQLKSNEIRHKYEESKSKMLEIKQS